MRPVDCKLPRPERTEAFDHVLRHRGIVRITAAIPAPRGEPPERLVNARNPRFLGPAGVAHEAAGEELGEALVERARQGVDETSVFHVDVDHREIAVKFHARRGQRAAVPRPHFGFIDDPRRPARLDRPLAVVQQRLETIRQHGQAEGGARLHQICSRCRRNASCALILLITRSRFISSTVPAATQT